ncbi:hypothetical protein RHMOL_Rhmol01G0105600 [Rhododendron molle]|nr:hypothetical protein RHMOL_Rhmol01G0105600 [Rhododendron molle]
MSMELDRLAIASVGAVVAVVIWLGWSALNWVWLRPRRLERRLREQGLSGTSYKLLFGDLKDSSNMTERAKSSPIPFSQDILPRVVPFLHNSVDTYDDEELRGHLRVTFLNSTFLDFWIAADWKPGHMLPAFDASCSEMISAWENMVSMQGFCELDVWPFLQALSSDVISRTAFGSNYEERRRIFQLQTEQAEHTIKALNSVYIPGWRLKAMKAGEASNEDLLGKMLESNLREVQDSGKDAGKKAAGMMISIDEVIEECKLFYFAGQETTSVLLVWTMVLLSKHPHWQQLAREEVLQVFGNNKPNFEGLNRLKIVTMILNEVLRLYPPAVVMIRVIHEETKLGRLCLPAGTILSMPIILLHHDGEVWGDDAKEFNPERFSEGLSKATKNGVVSFFPFGWGPRICIGQNFAMLEAKMAMAMILRHFSFELSPSYTHAPYTVITLQPQYGAHLILHKI